MTKRQTSRAANQECVTSERLETAITTNSQPGCERQRWWRRLFRSAALRWISLLLFAALLIGLSLSWYVAGSLVARVDREIGPVPIDLVGDSIQLDSDSGATLFGWHLRSETNHGVVVLLHGIRGNRLSMLPRARELIELGYSIVMIDFQAHGESSGDQITIGHLEKYDVVAAVDYARREHPGQPIGVIGVSLGGASALLASPLSIDALVIESVYPDISVAVKNRVSARLGVVSSIPSALLLWQLSPRLGIELDQLRPIDFVGRVGCPILVAGGIQDLQTTASETQEMFQRAQQPKQLWLVPKLGHDDLLEGASEEYREHVFGFLEWEMRGGKKSAHAHREEGPV